MGTVIRALEERGYSVAWRVLDAQYFGIPQRRRRVFIVGCFGDDWRTPAKILDIQEGSDGYIEKIDQRKRSASNLIATGFGTGGI
jgi:DNA (cytosine-5)-methyltransferase 1